ncbi:MAG: SUMF1/EgtB/PvdO family nonheme iron enzyme [Polyangiaceae bacterium]
MAGSQPAETAQLNNQPPPLSAGLGDMVQVSARTAFRSAFLIDRTEVTTAAYTACVRTGRCSEPVVSDLEYCNWGKESKAKHPINCVDWKQANAYCSAQGKRLPTEQEWEFAARGPDKRMYPWGEELPNVEELCAYRACCRWEEKPGTCPVGSFPAGVSPFGALDMTGNVFEWTSSNFDDTAAARVARGFGWTVAPLRDSPGLPFPTSPIFRAAYRFRYEPSARRNNLGFRCAR